MKEIKKNIFYFAFCFALVFLTAQGTPAQNTFLNVALFDRVYDLDPHTASYNSESELLTGLYEGLYSYSPESMEPQLALAKNVTVSKDKKTWVFELKDNILFSNGQKITSTDIKDSWLSLLATKDAPFASLLDCVQGAQEYRQGKIAKDSVLISTPSPTVLQVTLKKPTQYFDKILCHHALSAKPLKKNVYSGAFCLSSYQKDKIVFEKNQNYWDKDNVKLFRVNFLLQADAKESTHNFNNGDVDWVAGNFEGSLILNPDNLKIAAQFGTTYYFFKIKKDSIWQNKDFRNALLTATPWDKLREGQLIPASTLVFALDDYPTLEGINETDSFKAKQMLLLAKKQAGLKESDDITVTLALPAGESSYTKKQADILIKAWQDIGIKVNVQKTPEDRYLESIKDWDADIFSYSWVGDFLDPIAFLELFRGGSSMNVANFYNKEYDNLLNTADSQKQSERLKTLSCAEELLLCEGEILPVNHSVNVNLIDTDIVGGWFSNALDIHPLKDLYIKTKPLMLPNLVLKTSK